MTNNRLDRVEIHRIFADGQQEAVLLDARLQAIIGKLLSIGAELEDQRTSQVVLHLGRRNRQDVVTAEWIKRG